MGISGTPEVTGTNTALAARIAALENPPACRVYHNASQSINDATDTVVAFNSERFDTDTMHDTVTNNSRITFNTAGLYVVGYHGQIQNAADYTACYALIRLNGATTIARSTDMGVSDGGGPTPNPTTLYKFAVGDYVEVLFFHNNTANVARNLTTIANYSPEFSAVWVGLG